MALKPRQLDYAISVRPLPGYLETACGDYGLVKHCGDTLFVALLDALGHGPKAADVIIQARAFLETYDGNDLGETMMALHEHLRGTRGAVAGLGRINIGNGELQYTGIGNITAQIYGTQYARFVPRSGIVGYQIPKTRLVKLQLSRGDMLVLHTDGIPERINLKDYPELLADNAENVAEQMIKRFARDTDDAGCIVVRYAR